MATIPTTGTGAARWIARGAGWGRLSFLLTGPASYLTATKDALDLSDYFTTVTGMSVGGVGAAADALVLPSIVTTDGTAADVVVVYSWTGAGLSAALAEVTNATNLSGYDWWVTVEGTPKNSA